MAEDRYFGDKGKDIPSIVPTWRRALPGGAGTNRGAQYRGGRNAGPTAPWRPPSNRSTAGSAGTNRGPAWNRDRSRSRTATPKPPTVDRVEEPKSTPFRVASEKTETTKEAMRLFNPDIKFTDLGRWDYDLNPYQIEKRQLKDLAAGDRVQMVGDRMRQGELSEEAWGNLTPAQQQAVEFNDLLVAAVQKDRSNSMGYTDTYKDGYQAAVDEMFPDGLGSDLYAPATVNMLQQLNFQNQGQDLDEFISLDRAYTADELLAFQGGGQDAALIAAAGNLVTQKIGDSPLDRGMLLDWAVTPEAEGAPGIDKLQMIDNKSPGWFVNKEAADEAFKAGEISEVDLYFDRSFNNMYEGIRGRGEPVEFLWDNVQLDEWDEGQIDALFEYLVQRSDYDDRAGLTPDGWLARDSFLEVLGMGG